jgi:broad specificity phosphatase PhoE
MSERKFIWIRHANKLYCNGKAPEGYHQHDSPIQEDSIKYIHYKVDSLIKDFGFPNKIYVSPFLRTRQTVEKMLQRLYILDTKKTTEITIESDIDVCEYLGFQKPFGDEADVTEETASIFDKKIILGESLKNLNYRVKSHITRLNLTENKPEIIWIVTHGIVLNNIYYYLTKQSGRAKQLPDTPPSLSHISFIYNSKENKSSLDYNFN